MGLIRRCDNCYRNESECSIETYKVKKENYSEIFIWDAWEKVDICTDCLREIRKIVLKGKKDELR